MLPIFQKIEANINHSFYVEHMKFQHFPNPLQFHPDIEILFVIRGTGTRFVGDSVGYFGPGDLVMIGQNVPHVWYSDEKEIKETRDLDTEIIFVLFKKDIFGEQFWNLPESQSILRLINFSQRGIKVTGKSRELISQLMKSISNAVGLNRITLLLSILEIIASQREYKFLASPIVQHTINESDSNRLSKVYKYVNNNYFNEITLENVAKIANLSTSAFCRYFKKRANKTFIKFLNEIRVAHACRLLMVEDLPVASICYTCGYSNVSYFIKQFKKITGFTPLNYKKKYDNFV
ncbi:MAG: AraC family transcriptional regulator [Bacteroidetes bacterium]|nr:MAG: AraC family transcriptional regulator [Bacteroidota bacterium]